MGSIVKERNVFGFSLFKVYLSMSKIQNNYFLTITPRYLNVSITPLSLRVHMLNITLFALSVRRFSCFPNRKESPLKVKGVTLCVFGIEKVFFRLLKCTIDFESQLKIEQNN